MLNFKELNGKEEDDAWFNLPVQFPRPLHGKMELASYLASIKLDVKNYYTSNDPIFYNTTLENFAIKVFQDITQIDEEMYALDWQHQGYAFNPRKTMDKQEHWNEWIVPIFPNGDYYIFTTKDMQNVWFGHPWQETITLFGEKIINAATMHFSDLEVINIVPSLT